MSSGIDKRELLAKVLEPTGGNTLLRAARTWSGLLVLNYHRIGVAAESEFDPELFSASVEQFDRQVAYLSRHFDVIGLDDLPRVLGPQSGRGQHVLITFDDGYRDNYEFAFPVLLAHAVPAAFFLATGFLDQPHLAWWDEVAWMVTHAQVNTIPANRWIDQPVSLDPATRLKAIQYLLKCYKLTPASETGAFLDELAEQTASGRCPQQLADSMWMNWDMVREMRDGGMHFGAHTMSHTVLSRLSLDEQAREISGSRDRIEQETSAAPLAFSYPVGKSHAYGPETQAVVREAGYRWAFAYHGGYARRGVCDPFAIPRVAIERDTSWGEFRAVTGLPQVFA